MWRGCLHSHRQRAKDLKTPQRDIYKPLDTAGRRVDTDTPLNFIADGNRFLVLRSIGAGPATQATAQPRHHISHTGFSPKALGGMGGGAAKRNN